MRRASILQMWQNCSRSYTACSCSDACMPLLTQMRIPVSEDIAAQLVLHEPGVHSHFVGNLAEEDPARGGWQRCVKDAAEQHVW